MPRRRAHVTPADVAGILAWPPDVSEHYVTALHHRLPVFHARNALPVAIETTGRKRTRVTRKTIYFEPGDLIQVDRLVALQRLRGMRMSRSRFVRLAVRDYFASWERTSWRLKQTRLPEDTQEDARGEDMVGPLQGVLRLHRKLESWLVWLRKQEGPKLASRARFRFRMARRSGER